MKRFYKLFLAAFLSLTVCGCSQNNLKSDNSEHESSAASESDTDSTDVTTSKNSHKNQTTTSAKEQEPVIQKPAETYINFDTLPVISIQTKNQNSDALDFVTEPVNDYVSSLIASWTPNYKIPPAPYYEPCTITLTDTDNSVLLSADADVKVRGNWTTSYDKKPLRIKFDKKQSMLSLNDDAKQKNWVLLADYKDISLLRNKAAMSISREILGADNLYSADTALVEVVINGEYWGVYLLTEQQQISSERVNITNAPKDYEGTDIGYLMEFDGYYEQEIPLKSFAVDYADNAPLVPFEGDSVSGKTMSPLNTGGFDRTENVGITIKSDIYSQKQHDFIESYMNNVYKILYYAAYDDKAYAFNSDYTDISPASNLTPQQAVENVINVDSLADTYIICEVACDTDIYWSSFFMDVDFGENGSKKLTFEAPWDFDSAFGNKDRCGNGKGFYAANIVYDVNDIYETINPWLAVLMHEDWFKDVIREKWTSAYDSGAFSRTVTEIREDADNYQDAFVRNYNRWGDIRLNSSVTNELSAAAAKCNNEKEAAEHLASWIETRVDFLNDYWHK